MFKRKAGGDRIMSLDFEAANVTKPCVATKRTIDLGSDVRFTKTEGCTENSDATC